MTSFTNRTAVVTGAGSGIARALALALLEEGCSVAICDVNTVDYMSDDASDPQAQETRNVLQHVNDQLRDTAPTTAPEAATIILDGLREQQWRILVGADAELVDQSVRADPVGVYDTGADA